MQDINEQLAQIYRKWVSNVSLERPYKQRAAPKGRCRQVRQGGRCFKRAFDRLMRFAKKVRINKAFKNVAGAVLKEVPGAIGNLSKRVKNKKDRDRFSDRIRVG